jgi:hypothetical protein
MSSAFRLVTLLIELSGERSVTRCAVIVVTRLCLMTAAHGGIYTYIADRVFKSARTPKTVAALARSLEQRKQISMRRPLELLLVGGAKGSQQECMGDVSTFGSSRNRISPPGPPEAPPVHGRKAPRTYASFRKFFDVRTSDTLRIKPLSSY